MKQTENTIINLTEMNMKLVNNRLDDTIKDVAAVKESLNFQEDIHRKKRKYLDDSRYHYTLFSRNFFRASVVLNFEIIFSKFLSCPTAQIYVQNAI